MIKSKFLKAIALVLTLVLVLAVNVQVFGATDSVSNNFKNQVSPSNNVVKGIDIGYSFFMPENWRNNVNVYMQAGQIGDKYLEKMSFYYSPNGNGKAVNRTNESLFLTITVYATSQKNLNNKEVTILTQDGFRFTSLVNSQNNYKDATTRNEFSKLVANANSKVFLGKYLTTTSSINKNTSSTSKIEFKNSNNESTAYIDNTGVVYIPLRDFADAMGYQVSWYSSAKAVRITKGSVSDVIYHNADNGAYQTKAINNKIYVTTKYLSEKWKVNILIDNKNNVYIS